MIDAATDWPGSDLVVRSRRRRTAPRLDEDGRPVFDGRRDWIVEGPPERIAAIAGHASGYAERIGERLVVLDFGNAVGRVEIPYLGTVEVVSGKWDRVQFEKMLDDVVARAAELPFQAGQTGALPYARSHTDRRRILYHCFVYLRHVLSDDAPPEERLDRAYRVVLREPHREWRRRRRTVPIGRARRVDGKSLAGLLTTSDRLVDVRSESPGSTALARALGGRLPERIDERTDRASVDTPENRFLKMLLGQVERIIDDVEALAAESDRTMFRARVQRQCEAMRRKLRPVVRHSLWTEVGQMSSIPSSSTILQRRRGYRSLFRHYARLRMSSRLPLSEQEASDLLEIKDIALLYELWCFFRLSEALEKLIGPPVQAETVERTQLEARLPWRSRVRWSNGVRLVYNPSFSRSRPRSRRSYSVPLRPDILLEVPRGPNAGHHLFDAKFRLRRIRDAMWEGNETADSMGDVEREERRGDFKRGDLYKMHTYRDAIPEVVSVWILYPGSVGRFYSPSSDTWKGHGQPLPDRMEGVGALPLVPARAESRILEGVLARLTSLS